MSTATAQHHSAQMASSTILSPSPVLASAGQSSTLVHTHAPLAPSPSEAGADAHPNATCASSSQSPLAGARPSSAQSQERLHYSHPHPHTLPFPLPSHHSPQPIHAHAHTHPFFLPPLLTAHPASQSPPTHYHQVQGNNNKSRNGSRKHKSRASPPTISVRDAFGGEVPVPATEAMPMMYYGSHPAYMISPQFLPHQVVSPSSSPTPQYRVMADPASPSMPLFVPISPVPLQVPVPPSLLSTQQQQQQPQQPRRNMDRSWRNPNNPSPPRASPPPMPTDSRSKPGSETNGRRSSLPHDAKYFSLLGSPLQHLNTSLERMHMDNPGVPLSAPHPSRSPSTSPLLSTHSFAMQEPHSAGPYTFPRRYPMQRMAGAKARPAPIGTRHDVLVSVPLSPLDPASPRSPRTPTVTVEYSAQLAMRAKTVHTGATGHVVTPVTAPSVAAPEQQLPTARPSFEHEPPGYSAVIVVGVAHLSPDLSDALRVAFEEFGPVEKIDFPKYRNYAFVHFGVAAAAVRAEKRVTVSVGGVTLLVQKKQGRPDRTLMARQEHRLLEWNAKRGIVTAPRADAVQCNEDIQVPPRPSSTPLTH